MKSVFVCVCACICVVFMAVFNSSSMLLQMNLQLPLSLLLSPIFSLPFCETKCFLLVSQSLHGNLDWSLVVAAHRDRGPQGFFSMTALIQLSISSTLL